MALLGDGCPECTVLFRGRYGRQSAEEAPAQRRADAGRPSTDAPANARDGASGMYYGTAALGAPAGVRIGQVLTP